MTARKIPRLTAIALAPALSACATQPVPAGLRRIDWQAAADPHAVCLHRLTRQLVLCATEIDPLNLTQRSLYDLQF